MARPDLIALLSVQMDLTLRATIQRLTETGRRILLIVDRDGRLHSVVTDYDVRQAILNDARMDAAIGDLVTHDPVVADLIASEEDIRKLFRSTGCQQIPVLDADRRPVDVRFYDETVQVARSAPRRTAVVMAGGFGKRLRPMTDHVPKPLLEVAGRPILFMILDQIISDGFDEIYLTLYYKSEMIISRVRDTARYRDCVKFILEDEPLGTAGSLSLLPRCPEGPILVMNADLLTEVPLREMLEFHVRAGNIATVALRRETIHVPYGVADVKDGQIMALREKPALVMNVNAGVYIVSPGIFEHLPPGRKCDMPTLLSDLLESGDRVGAFPLHEFWLDIGTHEHFNQAQIEYGERVERNS